MLHNTYKVKRYIFSYETTTKSMCCKITYILYECNIGWNPTCCFCSFFKPNTGVKRVFPSQKCRKIHRVYHKCFGIPPLSLEWPHNLFPPGRGGQKWPSLWKQPNRLFYAVYETPIVVNGNYRNSEAQQAMLFP